jgi:hypothetical protein
MPVTQTASPSFSAPPSTVVRSAHAITIQTQTGLTIGLIQNWAPAQQRQITPIYELNVETSGLPYENIPGNLTGLTIAVSRYDLYTNRMEDAFGTTSLSVLTDQSAPIAVQEVWTDPTGTVIEQWIYKGVWFNNIGHQYRSDDNRLVLVNGSLTYLIKQAIIGPA